MNKWCKRYMILIGIFGQFLFYSQLYVILQRKSAVNVPLGGFVISLITAISWLIYGGVLQDRILITSNIVASVGAFGVVIAILIYR